MSVCDEWTKSTICGKQTQIYGQMECIASKCGTSTPKPIQGKKCKGRRGDFQLPQPNNVDPTFSVQRMLEHQIPLANKF